MSKRKPILVIPCSGIGKSQGSVAREATYQVIEELRPGVSNTVCLSLLTMGDEEAQEKVRTCPTITIEGCAKACALKNVQSVGGAPVADLQVADTFREHRDLKVMQVIDIGDVGRELAHYVAEKVVQEIDRVEMED